MLVPPGRVIGRCGGVPDPENSDYLSGARPIEELGPFTVTVTAQP